MNTTACEPAPGREPEPEPEPEGRWKVNPLKHLRLVRMVANKFQYRGLDFDDLEQAGRVGLLRACEGFNAQLGYKFSTYAQYWIKQSIQRAIEDGASTIRVPHHLYALASRVRRGTIDRATLRASTRACFDAARPFLYRRLVQEFPRFAEREGETDDGTVDRLRAAILRLPVQQREAITLRFGLEDGEPWTQAAIAKHMGVSRRWVWAIEQEALRDLAWMMGSGTHP